MYKIILKNTENKYDFNELIKLFLSEEEYLLFSESELSSQISEDEIGEQSFVEITAEGFSKNSIKQDLYKKLSAITGKTPSWGIHTGVRPIKMTLELFKKYNGNEELVRDELSSLYLFSEEKLNLCIEIAKLQNSLLPKAETNSVGLYLGIPFCPSRCLYCSFTSNQVDENKIKEYLAALYKEIEFCSQKMQENNLQVESIYIGGGTPTSLSENQLDSLICKLKKSFDLSNLKEFTVEAGRADTITKEKLLVLKEHDVRRISINPQSMNDDTLIKIGRAHTAMQVRKAFEIANDLNFFSINSDVIAGLADENLYDFEKTLNELVSLGADNITIHTLAVKRGSVLKDKDEKFYLKKDEIAKRMVLLGFEMLRNNGFYPYYLYKQKHVAGSLENTGFSKKGREGIYNIRIMDEHQTIVALGAGGISKAYFPKENRLLRVPNVSNYEIYISRIDDMLERKAENLFTGGILC